MKLKITHANIKQLTPSLKPYDVRDTVLTGFLARVRPSGTISYLVQYRDGAGRQQSYHLGNHGKDGLNPTTARDMAEDIRLKAKQGSNPHKDKKCVQYGARDARKNTLRHYLEGDYQLQLAQRNKRSAKDAEATIKGHFGHLLELPLSEITSKQVLQWRAKMQAKGRANETIKRAGSELDVLIRRAVKDRTNPLSQNPLADLPPVKVQRRDSIKPRFLSPMESKQLRKAMRSRDSYLKQRQASGADWKRERGYDFDRASLRKHYSDHIEPMVLLSLNTGIRQGELFSLQWSDIEENVLAADTCNLNLRGENTKSGHSRSIPLNAEARRVLRYWRYQTDSNSLIFSNNGRAFVDVKKAWSGLLKRAQITNFRWHDLRHDFASQLVIAGIPLNTVRELMGHATLEMTLRYAHLSNTAKAQAVEALNN